MKEIAARFRTLEPKPQQVLLEYFEEKGWLEGRIREYVSETQQNKKRQAIDSLELDQD